MIDTSNKEIQNHYDYIVVGAGAAGSVLAAELSASGAQVLVIESGGPDDAPTIMNPSIWFYNVGGPLDYHLPVNPSPPVEQSQIQYGPRPRTWRRHQHQCHGVDARYATGVRRVGGERSQGLGLRRRASGLQDSGGLGERRCPRWRAQLPIWLGKRSS
jgi:choline dehydrogenase-like flavoprotein